MEKEYIRELDHTYLVLGNSQIDDDEYSFQMILRGKLPGVLPLSIAMKDGEKSLRADVTACTSIASRYKTVDLTGHDLRKILSAIRDAAVRMPKLLMSVRDLCLEPDCVFLGPGADQVLLCYVPHLSDTEPDSIRTLSEFFLKRIDHSDQCATDLAYCLFDQVSSDSYILGDILQQLLKDQNHYNSPEENSRRRSRNQDPSSSINQKSSLPPNIRGTSSKEFPRAAENNAAPENADRDARIISPQNPGHAARIISPQNPGHAARIISSQSAGSTARNVSPQNPGSAARKISSQNAGSTALKSGRKSRSSSSGRSQGNTSSRHRNARHRTSRGGRKARRTRRKKMIRKLIPSAVILPAALVVILYFHMDLTQIAGMGFLCAALIWMIHNSLDKRENEHRNIWFDEDEDSESDDRFYQSLRQELYAEEQSETSAPEAGFESRYYSDSYSSNSRNPLSYSSDSQDPLSYSSSSQDPLSYSSDSQDPLSYSSNSQRSSSSSSNSGSSRLGRYDFGEFGSSSDHFDDGDNGDNGDDEEKMTRILHPKSPVLVSLQKDRCPDIVVNRDHLILGKSKAKSDIVISDNTVSREHARIERRTDGYYVTDLFSTNGTFLDGHRLESGQAHLLNNDSQLTIASLHYHVTIPQGQYSKRAG